MGAQRFQAEPRTLRFVTIATSPHRATLGMVSLQLLGFHFVRSLNIDVAIWAASK